jgi:hypothetical protein
MATDAWSRLITHLDGVGATVPVAAGRLELTLDGRTITVLITPRDWDHTVGTVWGGDVEGALRDVGRSIRALGPDDRFLVFENYELHPSPTEETPQQREDRETRRRIDEIRRRDPDARLGWFTERRDGSLAEFPEPPD